ncbi:hypothetical protein FGG78_29290, partial [Thioclava sp. BHET1]
MFDFLFFIALAASVIPIAIIWSLISVSLLRARISKLEQQFIASAQLQASAEPLRLDESGITKEPRTKPLSETSRPEHQFVARSDPQAFQKSEEDQGAPVPEDAPDQDGPIVFRADR